MVDGEDPANTAMFNAFAQRRDAESSTERKTISATVWVVAAVLVVVAAAIVVWLVA